MNRVLLLLAAVGAACTPRDPLPPPSFPLSATSDEAFRRAPPPAGVPRSFSPPSVHVARLDNGMTLMLLPREGAEVVAVRFVSRTGGEDGPADRAGWSWLVASLVGEDLGAGPAARPGSASCSDPEAQLSAPTVSITRDAASLSFMTHRDQLSAALVDLARHVQTQSFDAVRVKRARGASAEWLRETWRSKAGAALQARRMLYGADHRASIPLRGTLASLEDLAPEALQAHYLETWRPEQSALVVVGDIEAEVLRSLAEATFGGWTVVAPELQLSSPEAPGSEAGFRVLALQDFSTESDVHMLERGPPSGSADAAPFAVLAQVLGGMQSSRLHLGLQRETGGRRAVRVRYDSGHAAGELAMCTRVSSQRVGHALRLVVDEMRRLRDQGPTPEELEAARAQVREGFLARLETSSDAAELLGELFLDDAPAERLAAFEADVREVDAARLRDVARRWLRPDTAPFAVTGDLSVLAASIGRAEVGRAVYRR